MPATDHFLRKLSTMHVVFAASSLVLFAVTIWMMAADHDKEWRHTQRTYFDLIAEKNAQKLANLKDAEYQEQQQQLEEQLGEANQALAAKEDELSQLREEIVQQRAVVGEQGRKVRFTRAERDVARANLDLAIRDERPAERIDALRTIFDDVSAQVTSLETTLTNEEAELDALEARMAEQTAHRDEIAAELKKHEAEVALVVSAQQKVDPEGWFSSAKRKFMQLPIIDGFNSPVKIQQDWLPELQQPLGMTRTARFDRCRTCHLNIDQFEAGNVPAFPHGHPESDDPHDWVQAHEYPHPFASHPRADVYLTASSPHPLPKFGCTVCHEGQGSGTSFSNASHTPNNPHEAEAWEDEHHYHSNHFWEHPMLPERLREAACLKCHHNVVELGVHPEFGATAPKVYEGWQLITEYGCFGCHEIHGYNGGAPIGPDLRLEPSSPEEAAAIAADPTQVAGKLRKVGPSLKHVGVKTTPEWISYWTELPKRFRPETRMPQFFHLSNQQDELAQKYQPVELAAIATYLTAKSTPIEFLSPKEGYEPNAERGKAAFSRRGCLNCHTHEDFPAVTNDFGPNLSQVHLKLKSADGGFTAESEGFQWLYTWVRDPQRYHPRSRMPNLFLEPEGKGESYVDPAADIAAYLLQKAAGEYETAHVNEAVLDEMVKLYLPKSFTEARKDEILAQRVYPVAREEIKGDEIELLPVEGTAQVSEAEWLQMKLNYVGRRTISRYGCFGCHEISGFETARPIGTTLQDWGRKDQSMLALEHIEQYLEHHGEPEGSPFESTHERIETALKKARADEYGNPELEDQEMSAAYFYESLLHHGRAGFLWQKLREPRSYDYKKTATKGYDERLRMPKFPFSEQQIESIATFVLGLVADPPKAEYLYLPEGPQYARVEGERLLQYYNCVGCHMTDMPKITYATELAELQDGELPANMHQEAADLLLQIRPPRQAATGETVEVDVDGEKQTLPVVSFRGLVFATPDPLDDPIDQEYAYDLWEPLQVGDDVVMPARRILVPATRMLEQEPARGGAFAEWLVEELVESQAEGNRFLAWQMVPPPLYKEGVKVQTPWLFRFLKNPHQLRHTTVLRMPKFNMSDDEAQSLANYFAAVDGVPYPYQEIPQREPEYLARMNEEFDASHPGKEEGYLTEAWNLLNAPLCIKCHSVGGRDPQAGDPKKDIRGPNLDFAADRLRPDWLLAWLYNPAWTTPYTSMPTPFPKGQEQFPHLFEGDPGDQTVSARDALMNYHRLLEEKGRYVEPEPTPATAETGGTAGE